MIDRDYCLIMARYNAWQNGQLTDLLGALPASELTRDRGAFFGSILRTLNHILWGDQIWVSRFDGGEGPSVAAADSLDAHPTLGAWSAERFRMDGRIRLWAERLDNIDLQGELSCFSGAEGRDFKRPLAACVVQLFNHQTHHRGQVHAMLTAAGSKAPVSDIVFMPEEI